MGLDNNGNNGMGLGDMESAANSLAWYPWFPNRWFGSMAAKIMKWPERAMYRELLDWQWQGHGYLPESLDEISQLIGTDVKAYPNVLARFPKVGEGQRANPVLLKIWNAQVAKHLRRVNAVNARWKNKDEKPDTIKAECIYNEAALNLSKYLLDETAKATGRKLITTVTAVKPWVVKLLENGVKEQEIKATIDWLCGPNLKNEAQFAVQSGEKLYRRWDAIQAMMNKGKAAAPRRMTAAQEFDKALNEILIEARKRGTRDEQYEYLQSCFDKYSDIPRPKGVSVAQAALARWKQERERE